MEVLYARWCGVNVHQRTVVVCVRLQVESGEPQKVMRTFETVTSALLVLADDDLVLLC